MTGTPHHMSAHSQWPINKTFLHTRTWYTSIMVLSLCIPMSNHTHGIQEQVWVLCGPGEPAAWSSCTPKNKSHTLMHFGKNEYLLLAPLTSAAICLSPPQPFTHSHAIYLNQIYSCSTLSLSVMSFSSAPSKNANTWMTQVVDSCMCRSSLKGFSPVRESDCPVVSGCVTWHINTSSEFILT